MAQPAAVLPVSRGDPETPTSPDKGARGDSQAFWLPVRLIFAIEKKKGAAATGPFSPVLEQMQRVRRVLVSLLLTFLHPLSG